MKTPDEIKKGLECCISIRNGECDKYAACEQCPFFTKNVSDSDTITYINQLEAQVPKWISVDERLPEDECECLSINHRRDMMVGRICDVAGEYWCESPNEIMRHVTHWMPLPEPPKEG